MKSILRMTAFATAIAMTGIAATAAETQDQPLRINLFQPINVVDRLISFQPEAVLVAGAVYDSLVFFDTESREHKPALAEAWEQVDGQTIEFKLRQDVTFHDGEPFDADDVVYTLSYLIAPESNFPIKESRYGWIESVEKIDQYTVRVISKENPYAPMLSKLGDFLHIFPEHLHSVSPADFGKNPVGTGPYKVESVDPNAGIVLVANEDYRLASDWRPAARIARVELKQVPDRQTQTALLLSGQQDLMFNAQKEQAEMMALDPRYDFSVVNGAGIANFRFNMTGKVTHVNLQDVRVRKALVQALDREAIARALTAGDDIQLPETVCQPIIIGCAHSVPMPSYDPAESRRLLAEAGYPDGFPLEVAAWGLTTPVAEAVVGYLREVGIEATVNVMTFQNFVQRGATGDFQVSVGEWLNVGQPDVDVTTRFYFTPTSAGAIDDPEVWKLATEASAELDQSKRDETYTKLFDRINEEVLLAPVMSLPQTIVHSEKLEFKPHGLSPVGFWLNDLRWK